eukprot:1943433-Rhodomonas_salina.1
MLPRACYAVCSTELAHAATRKLRRLPLSGMVLRLSYAMCGTDIAYGPTLPTRYARMVLHITYAMSGTDIAYGATRQQEEQAARLKAQQ